MRRATRALWLLYAALAVGLLAAAMVAFQNGQLPGTAFFAAAAIGCSMAIVHTSWLLEAHHHLSVELDRATRPAHDYATSQADEARIVAAAADCCTASWATAGAEHDPEHCTRKDQTT